MKTRLYLAYGSNLSRSQFYYRCPDATIVGKAEIKDYELLFKGSKTGSYATIEPKKGSTVPVLVWAISEADEASLDIYEGVAGGFYYKKYLNIEIMSLATEKSMGTHEAMVYIMDERRILGAPSMYYYNVLKEGYERFGFDMDILEEGLRQSTAELTIAEF